MRIGIVTDSTADLPPDFYAVHDDLVMVPLTVHFGDEIYKDWVEMPPDLFYPKMVKSVAAGILPKTSQPPAGDFAAVYTELGKTCDHIISIHISSKLSGTMQSAKGATGMVKDIPVTLIDSEVTAGLLGSIVKKLVAARDAGADLDELLKIANDAKEWGRLFFMVDTLKYLELGGRIGKAQALLGTILSVKPILTLTDGVVGPRAKASGTNKAINEIISITKEEIAKRPPDMETRLILAHADNPQIIDRLKGLLAEAGVEYDILDTGEVGSVIGTYVGPGAFMLGLL